MRAEHIDLLFGDEDIVAAAQQRAAELRHECDRRSPSQLSQRRIGILPERGRFDINAGRSAHIRSPGSNTRTVRRHFTSEQPPSASGRNAWSAGIVETSL